MKNEKEFLNGFNILNQYYLKHQLYTRPITMANILWTSRLIGFEERKKPPGFHFGTGELEGFEISGEQSKKKGIKAYERNSFRHSSYNKM